MFSVGISQVDLTPPVDSLLEGYPSRTKPSVGVHDLLTGTAVVFGNGRTRIVYVSVDLIGVSKEMTEQIREIAENEAQVPQAHVMVSATHTHGGPTGMYNDAISAAQREYVEGIPG